MVAPKLLNIGHSQINPGNVLSVTPLSAERQKDLADFYAANATDPSAPRHYTCELRGADGKTVPVSGRSIQDVVTDLCANHGQSLAMTATGEAITLDRDRIERITPANDGGTLVHFKTDNDASPTTFSRFTASEQQVTAAIPGLALLDVGFARVRPRAAIVSIVPLTGERRAQVQASTKSADRIYTLEMRDALNRPSYVADRSLEEITRSLSRDFGMQLSVLPTGEAIALERIHDINPYKGDVPGLSSAVRFKGDPGASRQPFTLFAASIEQITGDAPAAPGPREEVDARSSTRRTKAAAQPPVASK